MKKIKILWMSNKLLSDKMSSGTGTWLSALAHSLVQTGMIVLGNLTLGENSSISSKFENDKISQFVVSPTRNTIFSNGLPSNAVINEINSIVEDFSPDIIHVWGTELFWGMLTAKNIFRAPVLLETQGLKYAISRVYDGGMTLNEKISCIGIKEIIQRKTIFQGKLKFARWSQFERKIISEHRYITTQSPWLKAHVKSINKTAKIFHNEFALQEPFYSSTPWQPLGNNDIFCSTSYPSPFKGLHVAIRATAIIKENFPNVQLRIAGAHQKKGLRQDGFVSWLNHEAKKLGVENNLYWLGPLTVHDIIKELQNCAVCLLPTFIEGYCLALAEAMMMGTPTVVSYTGGTSYLAQDDETALFFPPGDEAMCAHQVERIFLDRTLSEKLSSSSQHVALVRNNRDRIIEDQLKIYNQILELEKISDE